jgi:hypothetical protein
LITLLRVETIVHAYKQKHGKGKKKGMICIKTGPQAPSMEHPSHGKHNPEKGNGSNVAHQSASAKKKRRQEKGDEGRSQAPLRWTGLGRGELRESERETNSILESIFIAQSIVVCLSEMRGREASEEFKNRKAERGA